MAISTKIGQIHVNVFLFLCNVSDPMDAAPERMSRLNAGIQLLVPAHGGSQELEMGYLYIQPDIYIISTMGMKGPKSESTIVKICICKNIYIVQIRKSKVFFPITR